MQIRRPRSEELPSLQAIERAAGEAFRVLGMVEVADDEPPSLDALRRFQQEGLAWVAADDADVAAVPWNAPYYQRLGFRPLAEQALGQGLARIRADEEALGLMRWPRVFMRRSVGRGSQPEGPPPMAPRPASKAWTGNVRCGRIRTYLRIEGVAGRLR